MQGANILKPGKNCWRIEPADRVRFLIDGEAYFHAFRETAKNAQRVIMILGWDVDSRFKLKRDSDYDGYPETLGDFLNALLRRNTQLQIYILDWDFSMIYAPDRQWLPLFKKDWNAHRRLHFNLDDHHPPGASHHQKLVVIDDRVAFAGGLDFALGRWDTPNHGPQDTRRSETDHSIAQPYHDVQLMVGGAIATALGELARRRWQTATGQRIPTVNPATSQDPWPASIDADVADCAVGIARTYSKYNDRTEAHEVERLLVNAIFAAKKSIYIENQYFTAHKIGVALAKRLEEDDGPEIVLILPQQTVGWLSQVTMDVLRERLLKRLYALDRQHRLRVYFPYMPGLGEQCINVHAKVMIVDDRLARVGSANFNNRSMGVDSECDLVLEAGDNPSVSAAIARFRNSLLAEHLNCSVARLADELSRTPSLTQVIEAFIGNGRTLKPLPFQVSEELDATVPDDRLTDPEKPIDGDQLLREFVANEDRTPARRSLITLALVFIIGLALAASWRWTPLGEWLNIHAVFTDLKDLQDSWLAPFIVLAIYILGGLLVFPITLMIIATGVTFGAVYGFFYAILGSEISAIIIYLIGRRLGRVPLRRLSHHWVARISRRLAKQGMIAVITLRVIPVAPFTFVNLVAGAAHIRFRDFAVGTVLGMAPGALALTVFSDQVVSAIHTPDAERLAILFALGVIMVTGIALFSRRLLKRHV